MPIKLSHLFMSLAGLCAGILPCRAEELDWIPTLEVVTDLRDRGVSLSDRGVAGRAAVTVDSSSGLYGGLSVAGYGETTRGDSFRLKSFVGYAMPVQGYVFDVRATLDSFAGSDDFDAYPEVSAALSRDFGLAYIKTTVTYAPDGRWITPDNTSFYLKSELEVPIPGIAAATLIGRFGYDLRGGLVDVRDYAAGISVFVRDLELSATFEDSTQPGRGGGSVLIARARYFF